MLPAEHLTEPLYDFAVVHLTTIPPVLRWLQYFSVLKYCLEALAVNEITSGLQIQDSLEGVPVNVSAVVIMKLVRSYLPFLLYRDTNAADIGIAIWLWDKQLLPGRSRSLCFHWGFCYYWVSGHFLEAEGEAVTGFFIWSLKYNRSLLYPSFALMLYPTCCLFSEEFENSLFRQLYCAGEEAAFCSSTLTIRMLDHRPHKSPPHSCVPTLDLVNSPLERHD